MILTSELDLLGSRILSFPIVLSVEANLDFGAYVYTFQACPHSHMCI